MDPCWTPLLPYSSPHPSTPPSLAVSPALSPYNLSLPDCGIISSLWMADGRARWVYRGRTRAVVGVKYGEILLSKCTLSSFFLLLCTFLKAAVWKISERWHDLRIRESAWSSHGCFWATHLAFQTHIEVLSLQTAHIALLKYMTHSHLWALTYYIHAVC